MINLYPHQTDALGQTEDFNRCAYYLDMGLGKTFVGSEKMMLLGSRVNLIICQKSKVQDWFDHFCEHYSDKGFSFLNLTDKNELGYFIDLSRDDATIGLVGIINYELAWRRPELHKLKDFTLMLDESSLIQNRKAKQTKFILKLRPANVILLSGTPCSGKYENLWTQARLLGWDITEELYNKMFINWEKVNVGGMIFKQVAKKNPYKNIERLKQRLRDHGAVFMKTEEVFHLPQQNFVNISVPAPKNYKKFIKNSIVTVNDKKLVGDTSLTKMLYARQLCGVYSDEKLNAFIDILDSTRDRLVVFYNFTEELNRLIEATTLFSRHFSIVNGQIKNLRHYETDDDSVTFIQYQAGAMGLNLQKANKIIYYSLPLRSDLFEQSKKRIHRIGQNHPCFYYSMVCKGTIEEHIQRTLNERKDFTDELFKKYI